jgi:threonine dehydrogenase-like Zn-dependent dehydrogenase
VKAARLHAPGERLRIEDVPVPEPGPGDVLVRVSAAGICGSDLHIQDGENPLPAYPRTLGHEIAGVVERTGPTLIVGGAPALGAASGSHDATAVFRPGDRVCADFLVICGECGFCRAGRSSLCRRREGLGIARDGGFAEFVVVPALDLVRVPDAVPLEWAALATDAVATPFHAITKRSSVGFGDPAVVVGLGGLGTNAVRILRSLGAHPIVGVDPDEAARQRALAAGADAVAAPESAAGALAGAVHVAGRPDPATGADAAAPVTVFDFVGGTSTVELACTLAGRGGTVVVVGLRAEPLTIGLGSVAVRDELSVVGSYAFDVDEVREVVARLADRRLDLEGAITHRLALDDVNDGLDLLRDRSGSPSRVVITSFS